MPLLNNANMFFCRPNNWRIFHSEIPIRLYYREYPTTHLLLSHLVGALYCLHQTILLSTISHCIARLSLWIKSIPLFIRSVSLFPYFFDMNYHFYFITTHLISHLFIETILYKLMIDYSMRRNEIEVIIHIKEVRKQWNWPNE